MNIGDKIRRVRLDKGMTTKEFGALLGATGSNVTSWEKGRTCPNPSRLKTIAKLADMTVEELISPTFRFYDLKDRLKQMPEELVLKIFESRKIEDLVDGLKWSLLTGRTEDEKLYIGLITMGLMQHCLKNGFEFEACLSMAINQLNKE